MAVDRAGDVSHPNRTWAFAAAALGVALFCIAAYAGFREAFGFEVSPFNVFLLTPLFGLPLAVALWRQTRWWGLAYFVLWLTVCFFAATVVADKLYLINGLDPEQRCATISSGALYADPVRQQQCVIAAQAAAVQLALAAGLAGGFVGSAFAFAALLTAARFRGRRSLLRMAGATVLLAALGAAAFWLILPDKMEPVDWVLLLFLPWQSVFGAALVLLFTAPPAPQTG